MQAFIQNLCANVIIISILKVRIDIAQQFALKNTSGSAICFRSIPVVKYVDRNTGNVLLYPDGVVCK